MKKPLIILLCIIVSIMNPITAQEQQQHFPHTEPLYVSSQEVFSFTRIKESNNADKADLESLSLYRTRDSTTAGTRFFAKVSSFSTRGAFDYFLVESPLPSALSDSYIDCFIQFYSYTANPANGTWLQILLETTDETIGVLTDVEVPRDPYVERFNATFSSNETIIAPSTISINNVYAQWKNNAEETRINVYKNDSGAIFVTDIQENIKNSSTTFTDKFSWGVAKFSMSVGFSVRGLPSQAYANNIFIRIASPLNLTFSYKLEFSLGSSYTEPNFANFPSSFFLFAFIPLAVFHFKKRTKKAEC